MTKRITIAVSFAIALSALVLVAIRVSAENGRTAYDKRRISITSDYTKNKLSVPVLRFDDHPFMPVIHVSGNESGAEPNKASAIKIVPYLTEKGAIKVDVTLLFGDVTGITSCEQYKQLKQQPVASYYLRKGEKVIVSALKKFGLSAVGFQDGEIDDSEGCGAGPHGCKCGTICCYPNPGRCLTCGECGMCCRD